MKLVVGLGNPGGRYRDTRHNVGFKVVECLAARWGVTLAGRRHEAEIGLGMLGRERVALAKPLTFMNLTGDAVGRLRRAYRISANDIIAVYDDLDLPLGRVRIRTEGSAGGHNGVRSLIEVLGREFPRVRVGIGRPPAGVDPVEYVLDPFTPGERGAIEIAVEQAADGVETLIREGPVRAMNAFNRREREA